MGDHGIARVMIPGFRKSFEGHTNLLPENHKDVSILISTT
jgi:hypothetical protein